MNSINITATGSLTHLQRLESESIHILREVAAACQRPVMLYSIGKDSAVMLHLAMKAFHPAKPPFPLLHVDTTWKFKAMYAMRDRMAKELGFELLVHVNEDGLKQGVGPFTHGSAVHTDVMKTQALKQALDKYGFDAAFGGARRDEEKSRAKERIFSFRSAGHRWDPKNQRPELWKLYNARKNKGESIRVFPLSNWTELDIWQYIYSCPGCGQTGSRRRLRAGRLSRCGKVRSCRDVRSPGPLRQAWRGRIGPKTRSALAKDRYASVSSRARVKCSTPSSIGAWRMSWRSLRYS